MISIEARQFKPNQGREATEWTSSNSADGGHERARDGVRKAG